MKKLTAIILAALMAASLCACGSDSSKGSTADNKKSGSEAETKTDKSGQSDQEEESSGESKKKYSEYEDLSSYESIYSNGEDDEELYHVYISTPPWRSDTEYGSKLGTAGNMGYAIYDSIEYSIIISYDNEEIYSGDVENILPTTFPGFVGIIGDVNSAYYDEKMLPGDLMGLVDSQEVVELDCGEKAVKFTGTIPEIPYESFSIKPVAVYGYSFVYNEDINITIGYEIHDPTKVSEYEDMLTDIVDRMVKTIRTEQ